MGLQTVRQGKKPLEPRTNHAAWRSQETSRRQGAAPKPRTNKSECKILQVYVWQV